MKRLRDSKKSMFVLFLFTMLSAPSSFGAGEGTIPLRVSGRLESSTGGRMVSNADARLTRVDRLPENALRCLEKYQSQFRPVNKYKVDGRMMVHNREARISAICIHQETKTVEIFGRDDRGYSYKIIGRLKSKSRQ